jgi:hypothetical protein
MSGPFQCYIIATVIEGGCSNHILIKLEVVGDDNIDMQEVSYELLHDVSQINTILFRHLLRNPMDFDGVWRNLPALRLNQIRFRSYDFGSIGDHPGNAYRFRPVIRTLRGRFVSLLGEPRRFSVKEEGSHLFWVSF